MFILFSFSDYAQKTDSTKFGSISGVILDSTNHYALQAASVAVYLYTDTSLVSYQLSNTSGEYLFKQLPIGIPLLIKVFYTGYYPFNQKFTIQANSKLSAIRPINLVRAENFLDEVIVRATPPIRMNGDTLEFNADAFKLDKNAVGEDLLRNLPGVTVWADGSITVNGKQVNQVLVDGKPFFGNDSRIATQNISKKAIDKIQVYQQSKDINNPLDSITGINIKLKKGQNFGSFGKFSAGKGTNNTFEVNGNINFFNPRNQLGLVGTVNNVNKVANDAATLMRNSTFKGISPNPDFQPSFTRQGNNKPYATGIVFQHDFILGNDYLNQSRLTGNSFYKNNTIFIDKAIRTLTSFNNGVNQIAKNSDISTKIEKNNLLDLRYERKKNNTSFFTSFHLHTSDSITNSSQTGSISDDQLKMKSTSSTNAGYKDQSSRFKLETGFSTTKSIYDENRLPGDFSFNYSIEESEAKSDHFNKTQFTSLADQSQSKTYNRQYYKSATETKQGIISGIGDFSRWIFGYKNPIFSGFKINFTNYLYIVNHHENRLVKDYDSLSGTYRIKQSLTGNSSFALTDERPSINLTKKIAKTFAARFQKTLLFGVDIMGQFYSLKNNSTQISQVLQFDCKKFIPKGSISYSNFQYGEYQDNYKLELISSAEYPTVDMLVPLVDSANLYFIKHGNPYLKPENRVEFNLNWDHESFSKKNTFNYGINLKGGIISNNFSDSSITDSLGRSSYYIVNADGGKYLSISVNMNKAYKFDKQNQLQVLFSPSLTLRYTPNNINSVWNVSINSDYNIFLDLLYSYKSKLALNFKQSYNYFRARQTGIFTSDFSNKIQTSTIGIAMNLSKRINCNSNINFNQNTATGTKSNNFIIWNASLNYRILSDNSLEIKFDALDLLHQNTGIINTGSNNILTIGSVNVLQQYFMLSLSYFPRFFGKK